MILKDKNIFINHTKGQIEFKYCTDKITYGHFVTNLVELKVV